MNLHIWIKIHINFYHDELCYKWVVIYRGIVLGSRVYDKIRRNGEKKVNIFLMYSHGPLVLLNGCVGKKYEWQIKKQRQLKIQTK